MKSKPCGERKREPPPPGRPKAGIVNYRSPAGTNPNHLLPWGGGREEDPMKLLHEPETEDPILSVVNLIDIFLVIIAALLITVAQNPLINPFNRQDVTVITDPGKPSMEMIVKKGEKIEKYKANGHIGSGDGEKAGVAYRMKDGSMVYVPENPALPASPQPR